MGVVHHCRRRRLTVFLIAAFFLLLASASAIANLPTFLGGKERTEGSELWSSSSSGAVERLVIRRRLGGPGSSPPTCRSKCGSCSPCQAVHVPIQPGLSIPLEYYPEAWRCKCGNSLFMP